MRTTTVPVLFLLGSGALAQAVATPLDPAPAAASFLHQLAGDFDGDGFPDLYCFGSGRADALFRNDGGARFAEVTGEAGLAGLRSRAALLADLDGDGREDLLLVGQDGGLRLFRNGGAGLFEDVSGASGLDVLPPISAASSLHLDGDGRLDLRLEGERGEPVLLHNQGQAGFAVLRLELPDTAASPPPPRLDVPGASPSAEAERPAPGGRLAEEAGDPTMKRPAPRTGDRRPVGVDRTGEQGATVAPTGPTGPRQAAPAFCAPAIADLAGGCLEASSVPTHGKLFPLSHDFFIDAVNGCVGINTIGPLYPLQVDGGALFNNPVSTGPDWAAKGLKSSLGGGYLGVDGSDDFDGFPSADWEGHMTGVAGISVDSFSAAYGVVGHATSAGVRGEHASSPSIDYAELGTQGIGLVASGNTRAARFIGGVGIQDALGSESIHLVPDLGSGGQLRMRNDSGTTTFLVDSHNGAFADPLLRLYNDTGARRFELSLASDGAEMTLNAADGSSSLFLDGTGANGGGAIAVRNDVSQSTVVLYGDDGDDAGRIDVIDRGSSGSIELDANDDEDGEPGATLNLRDGSGTKTVWLNAGTSQQTGNFAIYEDDASLAFQMGGSSLVLYDASGAATAVFNRISGAKNGVVGTQSYGRRLLYAVESPEVWFEDFGSARLVNGEVTVELDPIFLETVTIDAAHPMKVYLTPTSPGLPLWVEKGTRSFTVRTLAGDVAEGTFDWRVVAKRKGLEDARLEPFEAPQRAGGNS